MVHKELQFVNKKFVNFQGDVAPKMAENKTADSQIWKK